MDSKRGINIRQHFTSVNTTRQSYKDKPFALACQVLQVFYLKDPHLGGNWHVVHKITNKNVYNIPRKNTDVDDLNEADPNLDVGNDDDEYGVANYGPINETVKPDINPLARTDVEYMPVHPSSIPWDVSNIPCEQEESSYDDTNSMELKLASTAHGESNCIEST